MHIVIWYFEFNLLKLIKSSTYTHGNILGLLTNIGDLIQDVVVLPHNLSLVQSAFLIKFSMSTADHSLTNTMPHYIYDYSKVDFEGLDAHIYNSNLPECLTSRGVEFVWSKISSTISDAIDYFIPKYCLHSHQFPKCSHLFPKFSHWN